MWAVVSGVALGVTQPSATTTALVEGIRGDAVVYPAAPHIQRWCPELKGAGQTAGTMTVSNTLGVFPPSIVVDVGAFDGEDAVGYAAAGHTVFSFEPTPSKARAIEAKVQASGYASRITFLPMALSNRSGTADFWVSDASGSQQDQLDKPTWAGARRVSVTIDTLDHIHETRMHGREVLYAKIDAQGHDPEVLGGMSRLLQAHGVRVLSFEVYPSGSAANPYSYVHAVASLAKMGYRCFDCSSRASEVSDERFGMHALINKLMAEKVQHRGQMISSWTNLVCMPFRIHEIKHDPHLGTAP